MMMSRVFLHVTLIFFFSYASAQNSQYKGFPSLTWPKLYTVSYSKEKDNLGDYEKPIFSPEVKALQGRVISLPGYMVPFENGSKGQRFVLTSTPLNACFFCGVGGPETVIEVHLKNSIDYTEKPIQVKGRLILNDRDPDKMIYIMEDAEYEGLLEF